MEAQLPALLVVIPLLAAPVCVLLRERRLVSLFSVGVAWTTCAVAVLLLRKVLTDGVLTYALGGWAAPWGIEYRVDALGAFVAVLVSCVGAVVLVYAPSSLTGELRRNRLYLFHTTFLLCLTGLLGITITGDLFNVFVFLEISALSSYVLIALGHQRRALHAAFQYLVMGTVGATFILIGIGLMYMSTGTLNMADMAGRVSDVSESRTILVAFAFLCVGLFLKMALFPLHGWLPNAYTFAPSVVSAFLAATATKVSVYILLRFFFSVFGYEFAFESLPLRWVLTALALCGIFVASTVAIFQDNVKRILAYSSVAQIGYMVLGIGFASISGLTGGIVHLFNHALTKGGMFLALGCIVLRVGSAKIEDMHGIGRQMPWTMAAWVAGGLGLIGIPLTAGFVSKWYLVQAALEGGAWPVALMLLLSSLLAVVYVWRVIEVAYFREPPPGRTVREAPPLMLGATWLLIGASLFFGVSTTWSVGIAARAAAALLGGSP